MSKNQDQKWSFSFTERRDAYGSERTSVKNYTAVCESPVAEAQFYFGKESEVYEENELCKSIRNCSCQSFISHSGDSVRPCAPDGGLQCN